VRYLGEFGQAWIRHGDDAHVWVNRAKGIILGRRLVSAGNGIKSVDLPTFGKPDTGATWDL
jgi:hypothetical protein